MCRLLLLSHLTGTPQIIRNTDDFLCFCGCDVIFALCECESAICKNFGTETENSYQYIFKKKKFFENDSVVIELCEKEVFFSKKQGGAFFMSATVDCSKALSDTEKIFRQFICIFLYATMTRRDMLISLDIAWTKSREKLVTRSRIFWNSVTLKSLNCPLKPKRFSKFWKTKIWIRLHLCPKFYWKLYTATNVMSISTHTKKT